MTDWTPENNRIQTMHLTTDEHMSLDAAIKANGGLIVSSAGVEDLGRANPSWHPTAIYRAKPAPSPTIICNGVEVPEPVREALEVGTKYYVASTLSENWFIWNLWDGDEVDLFYLGRGLTHLTEAAAVSHAKAMAKAGCV